MEKNEITLPNELAYDRGGKDKAYIKGVKILTPDKPKANDTGYAKQQKRKKFRTRAGIEPIIGHLKTDFRMQQNYLLNGKRIQIYALMAHTAWNLKKIMEILLKECLYYMFRMLAMLNLKYRVA